MHELNSYHVNIKFAHLLKVVYHVIDQELSQPLEVKAMETDNHNTERTIQWLVLHSRTQGHQVLSKMKKKLKRSSPDTIKTTYEVAHQISRKEQNIFLT